MSEKNEDMLIPFNDIKDKYIGPIGTRERIKFDANVKAGGIYPILKEIRKNKNMSQSELSKLIKVGKSDISKIESGKWDIQLSTFIKMLDGLNVKLIIKHSDKQWEI